MPLIRLRSGREIDSFSASQPTAHHLGEHDAAKLINR